MRDFKLLHLIVLCFIIMLMTACGKYQEDIYENIGPNETAYVVPLEGANLDSQRKFKSVDYLERLRVAAKRIKIPTRKHSTGYWYTSYEYIPTVRVIKVNRIPVTRSWNKDSDQGTSTKNQSIMVESRNGIAWNQDVTVTAGIPEKWASLFLYQYGGKSLAEIIDTDVKGKTEQYLVEKFSEYPLEEARRKKKEIFAGLRKYVKDYFEGYGIKIRNIGASGGFNFKDRTIQDVINKKYVANEQEQIARKHRAAAKIYASAEKNMMAKNRVEIQRLKGEAEAKAIEIKAKLWDGKYPSTVTLIGYADGGKAIKNFLYRLGK